MTDARSAYDESNEVWPFFLITLLGVVLVPLTINQLRAVFARRPATRPNLRAEHQAFRAKRRRRSLLVSKTLWLVVAGWVLVAYLLTLVRDSEEGVGALAGTENWDPYEILSVARSATAKEIKSAYRKLSLKSHPDKIRDVSDSVRLELEAAYVEITKAYRALTDEVTRDNFLQFGHPDGPQPVTHGVALPAFLFDPTASTLLIALYLLGFGVGVPVVVALAWTRSKLRTRQNLLQSSASRFAEIMLKEQPHFLTRQRILQEVLACEDMSESLRPSQLSVEKREELLHAYLKRPAHPSPEMLTVATECVRILEALNEVAAGFRSFILCRRIVELRRAIIQAVPFAEQGRDAVYQLMESETDSQDLAEQRGREYLPVLHLYDAEFRMVGSKQVYTNSKTHLEIEFAVVPLNEPAPSFPQDMSEKLALNPNSTPEKHNSAGPALPLTVAPHFPLDVPTSWMIYIYDDRTNKLMEQPLPITHMDLRNLKLSRSRLDQSKNVHYGSVVVPMSSPTPPEAGKAPMRFAMLNTTYFGCDILASATLDVQPAPVVAAVDEDLNDESEPESEDSEDEEEGLSDLDTDTEDEAEEENSTNTKVAKSGKKDEKSAAAKPDPKSVGAKKTN